MFLSYIQGAPQRAKGKAPSYGTCHWLQPHQWCPLSATAWKCFNHRPSSQSPFLAFFHCNLPLLDELLRASHSALSQCAMCPPPLEVRKGRGKTEREIHCCVRQCKWATQWKHQPLRIIRTRWVFVVRIFWRVLRLILLSALKKIQEEDTGWSKWELKQ